MENLTILATSGFLLIGGYDPKLQILRQPRKVETMSPDGRNVMVLITPIPGRPKEIQILSFDFLFRPDETIRNAYIENVSNIKLAHGDLKVN